MVGKRRRKVPNLAPPPKVKRYRCISLWEPWGSLIALGRKAIEMRPYSTKVRGDVLICCAIKSDNTVRCYTQMYKDHGFLPPDFVPQYGLAVALVDLYESKPLTPGDLELAAALGNDIHPGTFGWHLRNIRPLLEPTPVKGSQGFYFRDLDLTGNVGEPVEFANVNELSMQESA